MVRLRRNSAGYTVGGGPEELSGRPMEGVMIGYLFGNVLIGFGPCGRSPSRKIESRFKFASGSGIYQK